MSSPVPSTLAASTQARRKRVLLLVVKFLGVFLLVYAVCGYWWRYQPPDPPSVNLSGVDYEVVETINGTRRRILESPRVCEHWGNLGAVLQMHDFPVPARECWAVAERLAPKDPRWPYLISASLIDEDLKMALIKLRQAVRLSPIQAVPRLRLAELLLDQGVVEEAEGLFHEVLSRSPGEEPPADRVLNVARAQMGLGQIALSRQDPQSALTYLLQAVNFAPRDRQIRILLAQAYHRLGNQKASAEQLRRADGLDPDHAWPDPWAQVVTHAFVGMQARSRRIQMLERTGRRKQAIDEARQALVRFPKSTEACLNLGRLLNQSNQAAEAETVLEEANRLDPMSARILVQFALALYVQGKIGEAMERFQRAQELEPENPETHYGLALCLNQLNDNVGVESEFRAAIRLRPNYIEPRLYLAELFVKQGKIREARAVLEEGIQLAPNDSRPSQMLETIPNEN